MKKEIELLLTRSIVESNIYDVPSLNCVYIYSIFSNYCEVEVLNFADYNFDVNKWPAIFKTSYIFSDRDLTSMFPTSANLGISMNLILANKSKDMPVRFITKRELLKEALYIKALNSPATKSKDYWRRNNLGLVACSYCLTAGVMLAFIPQISVIDLLKLKSTLEYNLTK